jgi:hypothetical protein
VAPRRSRLFQGPSLSITEAQAAAAASRPRLPLTASESDSEALTGWRHSGSEQWQAQWHHVTLVT